MKKNNIILVVVVVAVVAGVGLLVYPNIKERVGTSELGPFASCLKDKGALFYGTFWCPHCQNQKKLFGSAVGNLPYIECSTADGQSQLPICAEQKIEGYPTWVFADASRLTGEIPLEVLADKTGCALPAAQ